MDSSKSKSKSKSKSRSVSKKSMIHIQNDMYDYTYTPTITEEKMHSVSVELYRYYEVRKLAEEIRQFFKSKGIESFDGMAMIKSIVYSDLKIPKDHVRDPMIPYDHDINTSNTFNTFHNLQLSKTDYEEYLTKFNICARMNEMVKRIEAFSKNPDFEKEYQVKIQFLPSHSNRTKDFLSLTFDIKNGSTIHISIHSYLYKKLTNQYKLYCMRNQIAFKKDTFEELFAALLIRYETMDIKMEQLACAPEFYQRLRKEFGFDYELFGSALNTQYTQYNSIFYDVEKYFLSNGNFYGMMPYRGLYVANPPFFESTIYEMALYFEECLDRTQNKVPLVFFITIPAWVSNEEYGEYRGYEYMKSKSKYLRFIKRIDKYRARFFDYYHHKIIYPCPIYFVLLSNDIGYKSEYMKIQTYIDLYFKPYHKKTNSHYQPSFQNILLGSSHSSRM